MLDLENKTALRAAIVPWLDKDGRDSAIVVIKGTFVVDRAKAAVVLAPEQLPILRADEFHADPATSSVKYGTDACPPKLGTDVVLRGHAYAPARGGRSVDVSLRAASLAKVVRIFGERQYHRAAGAWQISPPIKFDRIPLVWERAYGGADTSAPSPDRHAVEWQNPVGTGFAPSRSAKRLEGLALPNLEDPRAPVTGPEARCQPTGFGFVAAHWLPRRGYAGTYDDRWKRERSPYLPQDFDERFFSAAPPDLIATPHLRGGEPVEVQGASPHPQGVFSVTLPSPRLRVTATLQAHRTEHASILDTVVIEPDEQRVILTWKAAIPCARKFLSLERVTIAAQDLA